MKIIPIKGTIVPNNNKRFYDYYKIEATAPQDIVLPETNEDIEVHINSGGGSVFAGSEIYTALKAYAGNITVKVVGLAASAASVIAMAGDVIEISPTAQMMIHNVSSYAAGDHNALYHEADVLKNMNQSIANAYILKTGKKMDDLLDLMSKTTWFTAQQAVDAGFADKVMFQDETVPEFVASVATVIPQSIIDDLAAKETNAVETEQLTDILKRMDAIEAHLAGGGTNTIQIDEQQLSSAIEKAMAAQQTQDPRATSPFGKFFKF